MARKNRWTRPSGKRPQGKRFLIVVEGEITEVEYIQAIMRASRIYREAIVFDHRYTDPIGMVKRAKELRSKTTKGNRYDAVWCVFDVEAKRDQRARHGLHDALAAVDEDAKTPRIGCAVSNPCFEIWLLWHREEQTANIDSTTVQRRCVQLGITCGADGKHIEDAGALARDYYAIARTRAAAMEKIHLANDTREPEDKNPSSGVCELIDAICTAFPPPK
jgi:hypothetical protein